MLEGDLETNYPEFKCCLLHLLTSSVITCHLSALDLSSLSVKWNACLDTLYAHWGRLSHSKDTSPCRVESWRGVRRSTCQFMRQHSSEDLIYVSNGTSRARVCPNLIQLCSGKKSLLPSSTWAVSGEAVSLIICQLVP